MPWARQGDRASVNVPTFVINFEINNHLINVLSMLGFVFANKSHLAAVICSRKKFNLLHLSSCRLQA